MLTFVFGTAIGALGAWAYDRWGSAVPATSEADASASWGPRNQPSNIVLPTAAEIAGRPAEPLPRQVPEASPTAER